ncbi:MAG TPA: NADH-quinone oxidoreductase subunit H [Fimbriimonadaceae bacterium]|nr:NADH-quinone oxidoreductase subunit H [Fimbriimonadaceae bacterium]
MTEWMLQQPPALQALIRVALVVLPLLMIVPGLIWWERRLLSWFQDRIGPNRVATLTLRSGRKIRLKGLLQPIADGVKLFLKEDITPAAVDRLVYVVAPAIALFPAFALAGTLPWGPLTPEWLVWQPIADVNVGILYVLAISSLGVYGVVLGGYASNNKYSLMGALRSSAQLISYELAMGMALAGIVLATGSLRMTEMVAAQSGPFWGVWPVVQNWNILTPFGAVAAIVFFICMVAETNRAPFDLPEAENELIAGYHTEYSSMKFAVYFMGEYAAMLVFGGVFAAVFLGGFNMLPINFEPGSFLHTLNIKLGPIGFIGKAVAVFTVFIWLRATLPRLRYDQLMNLGWKVLLPVAVANFLVVAIWIVCTEVYGPAGGWISVVAAAVALLFLYVGILRTYSDRLSVYGKRSIRMVDPRPAVPESQEAPLA